MRKSFLFAILITFILSRCATVQDVAVAPSAETNTVAIQINNTDENIGKEPSARIINDNILSEIQESPFKIISAFKPKSSENSALIAEAFLADDKDTTKVDPKLEPLVLAGTGLAIVGVGAAVAGIFATPLLFLAALLLFAGSAFLTALGWKKIKAEPKKFKGEKFARANYAIIGLIGVIASFYLIFLLFDV